MKKSFAIIFLVNMLLRIIIQGLLPLYPIITERLGASKQENGVILACSYLMLLISTLISGKLVPKLINAKVLLLISVIPMCAGMGMLGFANNMGSYITYSLILFFFAGINIIAGIMLISHFSTANSIGENFGIIGLSNLLGSLFGGFIVGPILQEYGYQTGFILFASLLFLSCLFTFWVEKPIITTQLNSMEKFVFTKKFGLLLLSFVFAVMLIHVFLFSFSLSMKASGYNIGDISIYSAIGMAITIPIPYLLGKLTKKHNPKNLLILVYFSMATALLCLLLPKWIPIVLIAIALMSVLAFSGRAVIVAIVFPWFTDQQMPMAQAYMGTAAWLAAIIGYLFSGFSLQHFGLTNTLFAGAAIALLAIAILHFSVSSTTNNISIEKK